MKSDKLTSKYADSYWIVNNREQYLHIKKVLEEAGHDVGALCDDRYDSIYTLSHNAFDLYGREPLSHATHDRTNDVEFRLTDVKHPISEEIVSSIPTTSPYDEDTTSATNGAKEGDKFIVIDHEDSIFNAGEIVTLYRDDESWCPKFKRESGQVNFEGWYCLTPIEDSKELDTEPNPDLTYGTEETKEEFISVNKEDPTKLDIKAGSMVADELWDGDYTSLGTLSGRIITKPKKLLKYLI